MYLSIIVLNKKIKNMTLNVGIIGLGVGEKHIDGFEKNNKCKVVSICDHDPRKLKEVSNRNPSKKCFLNSDQLINDPKIDIISIATYDDSHSKLIEKSVNNGKHVFVEKPLCLKKSEYENICNLLFKNPEVKLSSNLILRKSQRFIELRKKIKRGDLGNIYYMEGDYDYGRINKILNGWRGEISNYSVMHGGGIHLIDLISWLIGKKVEEVFAYGTKIATHNSKFKSNDTIVALLKFEDGILAKISANFPSVTPHFHRLLVYGTNGTFQQTHGSCIFMNTRNPEVIPEKIIDPYPAIHKGDLIPSFVNSIIQSSKADISKQEVCDVMAISLAIEESIKTGSKIVVKYKNT